MERLTSRELRALLEFIRESYVTCDLDSFAQRVISRLPKLVPSEITTYNEVNPRRRRIGWVEHPPAALDSPNTRGIFEHYIRDHPLINRYAKTPDSRALKISDFLNKKEFHRLALYNEFYRRFGVEDQMAFVLPSPPPLIIGIALNRGEQGFHRTRPPSP